jgi:hypothetical protein
MDLTATEFTDILNLVQLLGLAYIGYLTRRVNATAEVNRDRLKIVDGNTNGKDTVNA